MAELVLALDGVETCYGLSQVLFGIAEGLRLVAERRFVWSSLGIELLVLVALWHAYETAFRLQNQ